MGYVYLFVSVFSLLRTWSEKSRDEKMEGVGCAFIYIRYLPFPQQPYHTIPYHTSYVCAPHVPSERPKTARFAVCLEATNLNGSVQQIHKATNRCLSTNKVRTSVGISFAHPTCICPPPPPAYARRRLLFVACCPMEYFGPRGIGLSSWGGVGCIMYMWKQHNRAERERGGGGGRWWGKEKRGKEKQMYVCDG